MTSRELAELAAALADGGLAELHLTGPDTEIHLLRSCGGDLSHATPDAPPDVMAAPGVGIFLTRHPLRAVPLAEPGRRVHAGQIVALLRVGLLLCPVTAPAAGFLSAPLIEEGAIVGYGTPLFHLHAAQTETQG